MIPEWLQLPLPILTFFLGFFASRLTLTKGEKVKIEQDYFKNSQELKNGHDTHRDTYEKAISKYAGSVEEPTFDHFADILITGDRYLASINNIAEAVRSGKINREMASGTFIPLVCRATKKTIPDHYSTLQHISTKKGFQYSGKLDRSLYRACFAVLEKHGEIAGEPGSILADELKNL